MVTPISTKQAHAKKRKFYFYLWVVGLAVVSLLILIGMMSSYDPSSNNTRYSQPFVNRMKPGQKLEKTYDPPGMKESNIRKYQGRGYQTY